MHRPPIFFHDGKRYDIRNPKCWVWREVQSTDNHTTGCFGRQLVWVDWYGWKVYTN